MRVFELAKELTTPNRRLIEIARDLGIHVEHHLTPLSEADTRQLRREVRLRRRGN